VKYRPKRGKTIKQNKTVRLRSPKHKNFGFTQHAMQGGIGDNLTTAEYRLLNGPPLAPRREQSRVITNFVTRSTLIQTGDETGVVLEYGWADVVSKKGRPFLEAHFEGRGRLPKRDLRGLQDRAIKMIDRFVGEKLVEVISNLLTGKQT
jgi:hypothetical protein